jgi:hypothetical protein
MTDYKCEWERDDNPTQAMTESAMLAYYKANSVRGDAEFSLRDGGNIPTDLRAGWHSLWVAVREAKETPAHRQTRDALRKAWRLYADGRPYSVPMTDAPVAKVRKTRCCPNCGHVAA